MLGVDPVSIRAHFSQCPFGNMLPSSGSENQAECTAGPARSPGELRPVPGCILQHGVFSGLLHEASDHSGVLIRRCPDDGLRDLVIGCDLRRLCLRNIRFFLLSDAVVHLTCQRSRCLAIFRYGPVCCIDLLLSLILICPLLFYLFLPSSNELFSFLLLRYRCLLDFPLLLTVRLHVDLRHW